MKLQYLFAGTIGVYLLSNIFPEAPWDLAISVLSLACVICTVFRVPRFLQALGLIFLGLGSTMLAMSGADWGQYLFSFGNMLPLLSLFALIPILALPIKLGNYAQAVQKIIQRKVKRSSHLYMLTSGLSYFLSSFLNLATLPMMYYSIRPAVDLFPIRHKERFLSRSITHGYSMPILWTPVAPIVGIVIEMTDVSWASLLPVLLLISLAGLVLDWMTGAWIAQKRRKNRNLLSAKEDSATEEEAGRAKGEMAVASEEAPAKKAGSLMHIFVAILLFNLVVMMLEHWFDYSFLFLVALLVIPFSLVWSLWLREGRGFVQGLNAHFQTHLLKMKDQFFIFLSAGFFLSALKVSGVDDTLNQWILGVKDVVGDQFFITLLPLIPFALAFSGLHPAVALALVAEALNPQSLHIAPNVLAVAMLSGAVTAFLMGPYNATLGIMSNIVKESPYRVSNWNAPFTLLYIVFVMLVLLLLQVLY
ncbi:hypothetical protein BSNK01_16340 [Bacillaceae bacterium]